MALEINNNLLDPLASKYVERENTAVTANSISVPVTIQAQDSIAISSLSKELQELSHSDADIIDTEKVARAKQSILDGSLDILATNLDKRNTAAARIADKLMALSDKD